MTAALYLWAHRREIAAALIVFLVFVLWFTIERQADRITSQNNKIKALNAEISQIREEYCQIKQDAEAVAAYLKRVQSIENTHLKEVKKNEMCIENYNPDSFIDRLNELFGYCEPETGNPANTMQLAR